MDHLISNTVLCLSVIALSTVCSSPAICNSSSDFDLGKQFLKRHKVREAKACFDRVIQRDPGCAKAYVMRGQASLDLEQRDLALRDLNRALEIDSRNWHDFDVRARIRYELNDIDGAIADATKAAQLAPREDSIYRFRSKMHSLQKNDAKALADLTTAIAVHQGPGEEGNYRLRADIYVRMKKYDMAIKDYTTAIDAVNKRDDKPDLLERYYSSRADAYEKIGKKVLAAADRKRAQALVKDGWGAFLD